MRLNKDFKNNAYGHLLRRSMQIYKVL